MRVAICINCLAIKQGMTAFPVGHEKGTQRDPYQTLLDLCGECATALEAGDMKTVHERYNPNPTVVIEARQSPYETTVA